MAASCSALDGGDDVAHAAGARLLQAAQQGGLAHQPAARSVSVPSEKLIVKADHPSTLHANVTSSHHPSPVGAGGPIKGLGHRRPPVDHQRLARLVGNTESADVQPVPVFGIEPPEAQGPLPHRKSGPPGQGELAPGRPCPPGLPGSRPAPVRSPPRPAPRRRNAAHPDGRRPRPRARCSARSSSTTPI